MIEKNKIYGYDEKLWYDVITAQEKTGDRDAWIIESIVRRGGSCERILDLGCGVGRISNRLAARGFKVTGIDLSRLCVKEARRQSKILGISKNVTYLIGDYKKLCADPDFPARFDVALCILAPSWKTLEEMSDFFAILKSKMRQGARLVLVETVKERFITSLLSAPSIQSWFRVSNGILSLHHWKYDALGSKVWAEKEFYKRQGNAYLQIARIEQEYALHSISDFVKALSDSGWKMKSIEEIPLNILAISEFNDPWWLFSALITAEMQ